MLRHGSDSDTAPWEQLALSLVERAVRDARRGDTAARQWLQDDPIGIVEALDIGQEFLHRALAQGQHKGKTMDIQHRHYKPQVTWKTKMAHLGALASLEYFLERTGRPRMKGDPAKPETWRGFDAETMAAYKRWMLDAHYAPNTINTRLSTVRRYVTMAAAAGVIAPEELKRISAVKGIKRKAYFAFG